MLGELNFGETLWVHRELAGGVGRARKIFGEFVAAMRGVASQYERPRFFAEIVRAAPLELGGVTGGQCGLEKPPLIDIMRYRHQQFDVSGILKRRRGAMKY